MGKFKIPAFLGPFLSLHVLHDSEGLPNNLTVIIRTRYVDLKVQWTADAFL